MTAVALRYECTALGLKTLHRPCDAQVERNVDYCVKCDRSPLVAIGDGPKVDARFEGLLGAEPCACGGSLKLSINRFKRSVSVTCNACGRVGQPGKSQQEAIENWNDRPKHGGEQMGSALERLLNSGGSSKDKRTLAVKISADEHERFKKICDGRGVSMAKVANALIVDFNASMAKPKG